MTIKQPPLKQKLNQQKIEMNIQPSPSNSKSRNAKIPSTSHLISFTSYLAMNSYIFHVKKKGLRDASVWSCIATEHRPTHTWPLPYWTQLIARLY